MDDHEKDREAGALSPASATDRCAAPRRSDERLSREAQALRDNLRRRKEQARARRGATEAPSPEADGEDLP
jgi:hypothetical protein